MKPPSNVMNASLSAALGDRILREILRNQNRAYNPQASMHHQSKGREEWERAARYGFEVSKAAQGLGLGEVRGWKEKEERERGIGEEGLEGDVDVKVSDLFARKMKVSEGSVSERSEP